MNNDMLAGRIRPMLSQLPGYSEKNMFGGICFMIHGNMYVGTRVARAADYAASLPAK